jgi:hypothetical protein
MPWAQTNPMIERLRFASALRNRKSTFTSLCTAFGLTSQLGCSGCGLELGVRSHNEPLRRFPGRLRGQQHDVTRRISGPRYPRRCCNVPFWMSATRAFHAETVSPVRYAANVSAAAVPSLYGLAVAMTATTRSSELAPRGNAVAAFALAAAGALCVARGRGPGAAPGLKECEQARWRFLALLLVGREQGLQGLRAWPRTHLQARPGFELHLIVVTSSG